MNINIPYLLIPCVFGKKGGKIWPLFTDFGPKFLFGCLALQAVRKIRKNLVQTGL